MRRIALAGGIGAGKSTAQEYLRRRGLSVIDADALARDVVEPGEPAHRALVDAFGSAVLDGAGRIDRSFLAEVVFHDASALRRLNSITHPRIAERIMHELAEAERTGVRAAFVALPLFRPEHRTAFGLDEAWALEVSPPIALERLVAQRGLSRQDAEARLRAQESNEERRAVVDRVILNDGTRAELEEHLARLLVDEGLVRG